ncbi:MAG: DUF3794 domain-containing protein [Clostridia bacterium]|nr:DUF3794 domain-containing protein [Clostridia bacterium]
MEKCLPYYEKVFCEKSEKNISIDVSLQEYLPNAVKVVKVSAFPITDECELQKDSLYIRGHIVFSAIYLSDFRDKLKCASFTTDFSHTFPARGIEDVLSNNGFTDWNVSVSDEKGQPVSQRKLVLSCKLLICADAYVAKKTDIFETENNKTLKKLCDNVDVLDIHKIRDCEFSLEDNITLEDGMPHIREIVFTEASVADTSATVSDGNINYSGDIILNCLYLGESEDESEQYISFCKKLPFHGSMPSEDISDAAYVLCKGVVTSVNADPVQNNYGESTICGVSVGILINAKAYATCKTEIISDIFSTKHDCDCEVREIGYDCFICSINESVEVLESARANLGSITDIISQLANVSVISTELSGKVPVFNLRANLKLCGTNAQGIFESINTAFNFKVAPTAELPEIPEKCRFDTCVHISDCSCKIENGEIKCNLTLELSSAVYARKSARAITAVNVDDSFELCRNKSEYIIFYPEPEDTVWSAAKRYRVSPEALLAVNGMNSNDTVFSGKKAIVIPRKDC